jgi:hypothetical protein
VQVFFYLIYVLILFNGVDDVMLWNSYGLSIRGPACMVTLSTKMLGQECLMCGKMRRIHTGTEKCF